MWELQMVVSTQRECEVVVRITSKSSQSLFEVVTAVNNAVGKLEAIAVQRL